MRNRSQKGFTLIELLIVIAIIGILAAVLIPNLLNARARAFDTAAQTCLKEIATFEEIEASVDPWQYTADDYEQTAAEATADPYEGEISSCRGVVVEAVAHSDATLTADGEYYAYEANHTQGRNIYNIELGAGVTFDREVP